MFIDNVKRRPRGRPRGQTARGTAARQRLYEVAITRMGRSGYEATTLRDIAKEAGVSAGLLYRYFPSKRAVIIQLYDELSDNFARQAQAMPRGKWRTRFVFALKTSLRVLEPHRTTLRGLIPVLVGHPDEGLFAKSPAFSRLRVQRVFENAVTGASDAPSVAIASALGRLLYLLHLAVLLWWLLDKSGGQRATGALVQLMEQMLPPVVLALRLPSIRRFVACADGLVQQALFDAAG